MRGHKWLPGGASEECMGFCYNEPQAQEGLGLRVGDSGLVQEICMT